MLPHLSHKKSDPPGRGAWRAACTRLPNEREKGEADEKQDKTEKGGEKKTVSCVCAYSAASQRKRGESVVSDYAYIIAPNKGIMMGKMWQKCQENVKTAIFSA